jgi:hypothetical protein
MAEPSKRTILSQSAFGYACERVFVIRGGWHRTLRFGRVVAGSARSNSTASQHCRIGHRYDRVAVRRWPVIGGACLGLRTAARARDPGVRSGTGAIGEVGRIPRRSSAGATFPGGGQPGDAAAGGPLRKA